MQNETPVIRAEDLTYIYSQGTPYQKVALDHVNLSIETGAMVGVIGHTGSGKSTLIQHFNGLLRPTSGKIYIDGEDMWAQPSQIRRFRFKVGLVFQYPEYQLFEETVYKDIAFGPKNMGMSESEIDTAVRRSAQFVGLSEDQLDKSPFELSGGQKRRVAIAGVLAMNPEVLILDEPTAGLDPMGRDMILGQIREYHQQQGNTVLLVSHSMEDVAKYCPKALVVNDSKLFLYDTVEEVFSHAQELTGMGLAVPQVSSIFLRLRQLGYPVSERVFTVGQARDELLRVLKEGKEDE